MKNIPLAIVPALILSVCSTAANENRLARSNERPVESPSIQRSSRDECVRFDFRWLELFNGLYSSTIRHIDIFLDPKAFREDNLKRLFEHLSKVNRDPDFLIVSVYTDWNQIDPAAPNCPGSGMSEMPAQPDEYDYLQATFWRRGEREYFRYSPKIKVHAANFTEVIIRGPKKANE